MQDYIDVLLCHLADARQNALPGEYFPLQAREYQTLDALTASFTADQRKLFLAYEEARNAADLAMAYREVIAKIIHLAGLNIELCGAWLWVSGETYANREALKAAGLRYASKKQMWYWRPEEAACPRSRRGATMNDIRRKYGSDRIKTDGSGYRPALAQ